MPRHDSGIAAGAFGLGGQFGLGTPRNPILEGWEAGNRGQRHGYCISSTQAASRKPRAHLGPAHTHTRQVCVGPLRKINRSSRMRAPWGR
jgi:hypothetical protein